MLIEYPHRDEIADLQNETAGLLEQTVSALDTCRPSATIVSDWRNGLGDPRSAFRGLLRELGECAGQLRSSLKSLVEHDVIDRKRKQCVRFTSEIGDSILDGGVDDWIAVELVGNPFVVSFEQILVDAIVLVEQLQGGFQTLGETVDRRRRRGIRNRRRGLRG